MHVDNFSKRFWPGRIRADKIRGSFGKFLAWHHVDKMLSNNTILETTIQRLLHGLIFVKKGLGAHVKRMLKMSRGLYTGGNLKQKKKKKNWKKAKEN